MRIRDYRDYTFKVCMKWIQHPTAKNLRAMKINLERWKSNKDCGPLIDYGYEGDFAGHLHYCSDRMNQGRAKALLRLLKNLQ